MAKKKITIEEIGSLVKRGFAGNRKEFGGIRKDIGVIREDIGGIHKDIAENRKDIKEITATMATKEDLKGLATKDGVNSAIEGLAVMTKKGFDGMDRKFNEFGQRLNDLEELLDNIRKLILADHKRRIESLEEQMKDLKSLFLIK